MLSTYHIFFTYNCGSHLTLIQPTNPSNAPYFPPIDRHSCASCRIRFADGSNLTS